MLKIPRANNFKLRTYPVLEYGINCYKVVAIKFCLLSFRVTVLCKKEAWLSIAVHKNTEQRDAS